VQNRKNIYLKIILFLNLDDIEEIVIFNGNPAIGKIVKTILRVFVIYQ